MFGFYGVLTSTYCISMGVAKTKSMLYFHEVPSVLYNQLCDVNHSKLNKIMIKCDPICKNLT